MAFNNSLIGFLIIKSAHQIDRLLLLCYSCHMTFISGIKIIGIIILMLRVVAPDAAFADWKIYYTGVIGQQSGYHGRGSFAAQLQCEQYRMTMPGVSMSYCSGFDTPTQSRPSGDDGTAAREQEKQRQLQLQREQKEKEQKERELELARQKKFAEEKDKLLGSSKGTSTGTLGLKGASSGTLGLKTGTGPVSGCIEKNRACVLNGTSCCAPYSCKGKFPNTYCGNVKRTDTGTFGLKTGKVSVDPKALQEQNEFEKMNAEWMKKQKQLIEQRLREPNKDADVISKSLKTNTPSKSLKTNPPPPLPPRKYEMLKPGDVLLISPDDTKSFWINFGDRLSSASQSSASHTVLFLKEVNGKKLFLDHTSERGSHVISEEEFLSTYGHRDALVAQPVKEADTTAIWERTKELVKKEQKKQAKNTESRTDYLRDKSGYGLYGPDNMVCSEAARWILINSGLKIPETASPLKRLLGIHYGPANFFSDDKNFIITPLYGVPQ
jgi:hypothetical protein